MAQEFDAICFDLFSTLVNVGDVPAHIGAYTADILGVGRQEWNQVCFSEAHEICTPTDHFTTLKKLAHLLNPAISEQTIKLAVQHRQARFDYALREIQPDVLHGLALLRDAGYKLALVSNASSAEVQAWADSPLDAFFDHVIFSYRCGSRKPQPAIYHAALEYLQVAPQACLFVGDGGSEEHFGAKQCAMVPVLMTRFLNQETLRQKRRELQDVVVGEASSVAEISARMNDYKKAVIGNRSGRGSGYVVREVP